MNHITWSVVSQSRYLRMSVRAERQMVGVCEVAARVAGLDAAACERVLRRWGVARVRGCPVPSASLGGAALSAWGGACRRAGVCAAEVSAEAAELGAALPAGWAAALAGRRGRPKAAALQVVGVAAPSDAPSAGDVFAELAAEAGGAAAGGAAVKTEKAAGASQGGATPSEKAAAAAEKKAAAEAAKAEKAAAAAEKKAAAAEKKAAAAEKAAAAAEKKAAAAEKKAAAAEKKAAGASQGGATPSEKKAAAEAAKAEKAAAAAEKKAAGASQGGATPSKKKAAAAEKKAAGASQGGATPSEKKAAGASQGGATPSKKKAGAAPALLAALHPSEGAPDDGELGEEAYEATFTKGGAKPALGASQGGASQGGASGDPPSEETEVSVRVFEHEGVRWLKDDDDVLYDPETHEEVGRWSEAHQVVEL